MSAQRQSSPFYGLKIAIQVMGHDCMKLVVPALTAVIGLATISLLMRWSWTELQGFQPDLSAWRSAPVQQVALVPDARPQIERPVYRAAAPRVAKKKPKRIQIAASRPVRRPSLDEYYWGGIPDNPTGGRIVRGDSLCTEYCWDK